MKTDDLLGLLCFVNVILGIILAIIHLIKGTNADTAIMKTVLWMIFYEVRGLHRTVRNKDV